LSVYNNEALLSDLVILYDSLHKTPKAYFKDGYPMIRVTDINRGSLRTDGTMRVDKKTYEEFSKKYKPEVGDIVLSRVGSYGNSAIVTNSEPFCLGQNTVCLSPIREKVFPHYLYCCLNSRFVLAQFDAFITGASQPTISLKNIRAVRIPLPQINIQRRVSQAISAYDDLIENNRRRIQLLEQAARLLYHEWFVHLRFPGHEHTKIIDGVPEGWEKKYVPEVIDINPKEKIQKGTVIRYVPMAGLSTTGMTVDLSESEIRSKSTSVRYRNGDVLLARITPCLENGKTGFVNFLAADEVACGSTEFIILRGRLLSPFSTYCLARTHTFRETAIKSMIGSSGRQRVQPQCFDEFSVGLPKKVIRDQFDDTVSPFFRQIATLVRMNVQLIRARDLILPKLMNGEVAV
jgi:type I restriction enzyme, S subunit